MIARDEVCCDRMWKEIGLFFKKELNRHNMLESSVWYEESTREYVLLADKAPDDYMGSPISFCPFCGSMLPSVLNPEDTILKEYGDDYVRYTFDPLYKELPADVRKEFKTDEWWKKRGL